MRILSEFLALCATFTLAWSLVLVEITDSDGLSKALITLPSGSTGDLGSQQQLTLDLRILASTTSCGNGNVTVSGQPLAQDNIGTGSGEITTEEGNVLNAEWKFSCVHLSNESEEQLLAFRVDQIDGQRVTDVAFSVQFQKVAPVSIKSVDGATVRTTQSSESKSPASHQPSLEDELAELRSLEEQLLSLEHSIASKISQISNKYGIDHPENLLPTADCHGIKCLLKEVYVRIKGMATNLYHGSDGSSASPNGPPAGAWLSYDSHGGQRPLSETENSEKGSNEAVSSQKSGHTNIEGKPDRPQASLAHKETAENGDGNNPQRRFRILVLSSVIAFLLISVLFVFLGISCVTCLRRRREARQEKRRQRVRAVREACNVMAVSKYIDVIQWLRDGMGRQGVRDEEKQAEANGMDHHHHHRYHHRHHRQQQEDSSGNDSEDALSTTMEEELAQFRAAAGVVSNLISSGGISGRLSLPARPRRDSTDSTPSSIASACPTYRTVDDTLPPYEEEERSEGSVVADGFRYMPGHQPPEPPRTTRTSLDCNIGEPKN